MTHLKIIPPPHAQHLGRRLPNNTISEIIRTDTGKILLLTGKSKRKIEGYVINDRSLPFVRIKKHRMTEALLLEDRLDALNHLYTMVKETLTKDKYYRHSYFSHSLASEIRTYCKKHCLVELSNKFEKL